MIIRAAFNDEKTAYFFKARQYPIFNLLDFVDNVSKLLSRF